MRYRNHAYTRTSKNTVLREIKNLTRGKEIFRIFIGAIFFFAPLILYVGIIAESSRLTRATDAMRNDILQLKEQNRKLLVERAELSALKRAEEFATEELSMTAPSAESVVLVRGGAEPIRKNDGETDNETSSQTAP